MFLIIKDIYGKEKLINLKLVTKVEKDCIEFLDQSTVAINIEWFNILKDNFGFNASGLARRMEV